MDVTIAILPFKSLVVDDPLDQFMAGFSEDLVINLSKFSGLAVISPQSVTHIKNIDEDEAVAELGADYIVHGSFRSIVNKVSVGIQLTRIKDSKIVFASEYSESNKAILDMMDHAVKEIVNAIQQHIDYDLLSFSYKKETTQLAAYENYLLGMDRLKKGGAKHDLEARKYFEAALRIDPAYARAYTGLSLSYFNVWSCQLWDRWDVAHKGAQKFALEALDIDENDYTALAVAGRTFIFSEDYEKAEHYLRKSIRINPNDANNLVQVAFSMIFLGLAEEAEKLYRRACKLNPLHTDAYFGYGSNIYFEVGDYEKAITLGRKLNEEDVWVDFPAYMAAAYFHLSDFSCMHAQWNRYLALYASCIEKSSTINESQALQWQINVNPYKNKTNLQPFWNYIAEQKRLKVKDKTEKKSYAGARFLQKGEMWEVSFKGQSSLFKNTKGFHDIFKLLTHPEEGIHCTELIGINSFQEKGIEVFDQQAKTNYQKRLLELQADIEEAEVLNDFHNGAKLQEQYDNLLDHLSKATGMGGKTRTSISTVDKARSAVTWRIRSSIKKMEKIHPQLANHFSKSINTGIFCSYKPEFPIDWET